MKKILLVVLVTTIFGFCTSCNKEKKTPILRDTENISIINNNEEENVSEKKEMKLLLHEIFLIDQQYNIQGNLQKKISLLNEASQSTHTLKKGFWAKLKRFFKKAAVVISDGIGGVIGGAITAGNPGGVVVGASVASAGAASIIYGSEVTTLQKPGEIGFELTLRNSNLNKLTPILESGYIHNQLLTSSLSNDANFLLKSKDEQYNILLNKACSIYNVDKSTLSKNQEIKNIPYEKILKVFEGNYSSDEELCKALAKAVNISYERAYFILNLAVNSITLLEDNVDNEDYADKIAQLIADSKIKEATKKELLYTTALTSNSAYLWTNSFINIKP